MVHPPAVVRYASLGLVAALAGLCALAAQPAAATSSHRAAPHASVKAPPVQPRLVVPNVVEHAFVFAKGELDDAGFAWRVVGPVHGFAANRVVHQWPAAGTRVLDTGAPLVSLKLRTNWAYSRAGEPQDNSSVPRTPLVRAG